MSDAFRSDELFACHIPAIELLIKLGYHFLTPEQALAARGGRAQGVLLEEVLRRQLGQINRIVYLDDSHLFSEANLATAIDALKMVDDLGLAANNARLYQLLVLGMNLSQPVAGDNKSHAFRFIDWQQPENNVFHLVADFAIHRPQQRPAAKFDVVLFVNGIPFVVIKCLAPRCAVELAQQTLQTAQNESPPSGLFSFLHFMLALNGKDATVAAVGRDTPLWSRWREPVSQEELQAIAAIAIPDPTKIALYDLAQARLGPRAQQERAIYHSSQDASLQDQTLYAMCRPKRLLELVREATLFEGGERKLARYPQYLAVQRALKRVRQWQDQVRRQGGILVHAEGSGKSLLMLFLARQLALLPDCQQPRIVVLSQRPDLGLQLGSSFAICPVQTLRAKSSRKLLEAIASDTAQIVFSLPFEIKPASGTKKNRSDSNQIFFLIDEDHRTTLGSYYTLNLQELFPNACYIGFSGTPLQRHERQFAQISSYSAQQAQKDGLLVPLLYEARNAELGDDPQQFSAWLARHASDYDEADRARLQQVYEKSRALPPEQRRLADIAIDICLHYRSNYHGSGLKAQLVTLSNGNAFDFKKWMDQLGQVDATVITSKQSIADEVAAAVGLTEHNLLNQYWHKLVAPYGNEDAFRHQVQHQFMFNQKPELIIVVNQVDPASHFPNNAVLYLVCHLSGRTFLQAVASVNQVAPDQPKPYGHVIEYVEAARLPLLLEPGAHPALAHFDPLDLQETLFSAAAQIQQLPDSHAHLWALFRLAQADAPQALFERELNLPALRAEFYQRMARFCNALNLALGNAEFMRLAPEQALQDYQHDARRFFQLKKALQLRYGETAYFSAAERMLWQQLAGQAGQEQELAVPVIHILDPAQTRQTLDQMGLTSAAARADAIAHHILNHIEQLQQRDNQQHQNLSHQLQGVLDDVVARRIENDDAYLARVEQCYQQLIDTVLGQSPQQALEADGLMLALYAMFLPHLNPATAEQRDAWAKAAALTFCDYLAPFKVSRPVQNQINHMKNLMDDYLYDVMEKDQQLLLTGAQKDQILHQSLQFAEQYWLPKMR